MKPGSGSPFFRSVPLGNPGEGRRPAPAWTSARYVRGRILWVSGRLAFHDRSFGDFPVFHVVPEGDEQFARQRHNPNTSEPTTAVSELALIPLGQRTIRLVANPAPGELHHEASHMLIPGARDALIMVALAALIWGRHEADQAGQLPPIFDVPPPKDFGGQRPRADRADPTQGGQGLDIAAHRGLRIRREGFWLHRWLGAHGVSNHVIESSSIEVNRRARRAKTDRLDLGGLLNLLARHQQGDTHPWRVVRVPSVEEEDARQLHRTRATVQQDRNRLINRLKALLLTQGLALAIDAEFPTHLETARLWDGRPIPTGLHERLQRSWAQLAFLNRTLAELDAERATRRVDPTSPLGRYVHALPTLRGIGPVGAWTLATEIFGWRQIKNGRELGALVGLVPAPYQSGETAHDQGITRAGNKHVRRVMVQLAWSWVRYQPASALSRWYQRKFGHRSRRLRRIGIVAVARKLLVALWRYVEHGEIPEGAIITDQAA